MTNAELKDALMQKFLIKYRHENNAIYEGFRLRAIIYREKDGKVDITARISTDDRQDSTMEVDPERLERM